jgi:hypothetical protein
MVVFKRCEKEVIQKGGNSDEKSFIVIVDYVV